MNELVVKNCTDCKHVPQLPYACSYIDMYCLGDIEKTYQQGRAEAIDECLVLVDKIMPPQPYLLKSRHYENWKIKTTELRMLRDMLEQLKEKK